VDNWKPVNPAKDVMATVFEGGIHLIAGMFYLTIGLVVIAAVLAGAGLIAAVIYAANYIGG
jgi:hypothetical protein